MKKKIGMISGFIIGVAGFLLLFKLIILDNTSPADELAPGIVVIVALLSGLIFAFIGSQIQNYFAKKRA